MTYTNKSVFIQTEGDVRIINPGELSTPVRGCVSCNSRENTLRVEEFDHFL